MMRWPSAMMIEFPSNRILDEFTIALNLEISCIFAQAVQSMTDKR